MKPSKPVHIKLSKTSPQGYTMHIVDGDVFLYEFTELNESKAYEHAKAYMSSFPVLSIIEWDVALQINVSEFASQTNSAS